MSRKRNQGILARAGRVKAAGARPDEDPALPNHAGTRDPEAHEIACQDPDRRTDAEFVVSNHRGYLCALADPGERAVNLTKNHPLDRFEEPA